MSAMCPTCCTIALNKERVNINKILREPDTKDSWTLPYNLQTWKWQHEEFVNYKTVLGQLDNKNTHLL